MGPWKFLQLFVLPISVIAAVKLGGLYTFVLPLLVFILRPLYSLTFSRQIVVAKNKPSPHGNAAFHRIIALSFVPVLIAMTVYAMIQSCKASSPFEFAGIILSTGTVNGIIGFTLAHELIHRNRLLDNIAGHLLLLQNNYLHYSIEHIRGHHVYACTPEDPHTAHLNESFYKFLPRTILYTFVNATRIERRRLQVKGNHHSIIGNRMVSFLLLQLIMLTLVLMLAGERALLFLLFQSAIAIVLLHITNYLQHYGLMRKVLAEGQFERVNARHAWSSPSPEGGLTLFHLENHADHHMHPNRPYEQLVDHHDSPVHPSGYSGMLLLALIPPLWFREMNRRIKEHTNKTA